MTSVGGPGSCEKCRHYTTRMRCAAFPDGIPNDILDGEFDHRQPHEGDHGVQWAPRTANASGAPAAG